MTKDRHNACFADFSFCSRKQSLRLLRRGVLRTYCATMLLQHYCVLLSVLRALKTEKVINEVIFLIIEINCEDKDLLLPLNVLFNQRDRPQTETHLHRSDKVV